jgi:RimJ/RimL family protein N-acetyltransferase
LDLAGTTEQVERFVGAWQERGIGILSVLDAVSGEFLGRAGVKYWPQFDETEAGWVLRRDVWGRGYATEAGRATLRWALIEHGLAEVTAIIADGNAGSVAVARRLGMQPKRRDHIFGVDCTVFATSSPPAEDSD